MKALSTILLGAGLALACCGPCLAGEEELAPGYNACMEKAYGDDVETRECMRKAHAYWDRKLNENYRAAKESCSSKACAKKLLEAERAWLKWRDLMAELLYESRGGGSMNIAKSIYFEAEATKLQAQKLARLAGEE